MNGGKRIELKDREHLPYAMACLLELQRYSTLAPVHSPHVALVDSAINGYVIKK